MTDEKRIEEIRATIRSGGELYWGDGNSDGDVAFLLSALDAERARADRAEAERDARPAITPELAICFLAHETDPCVFRKVTDAVADFGTAMEERAAKSRPSPARCEICDWPLHDTIDKGCTAESCSYRPEFGSEEHRRIAARRKEIAAKAGGGT